MVLGHGGKKVERGDIQLSFCRDTVICRWHQVTIGGRLSFVHMVITYRDNNIAQGGRKDIGQALVNQSVEMNIAAVLKFIPLQGVKDDFSGISTWES